MKPSQFGLPYRDVTVTTKDNILLQCYLLQQKDEEVAKNSPTVIYFHANAGNMVRVEFLVQFLTACL
jgi:abhydrolase domain-containing protein 13